MKYDEHKAENKDRGEGMETRRNLLALCKSIMVFLLVLILGTNVIYASDLDISVRLNGIRIGFDQPPIIQEGRTLVPMRAIFESLGCAVTWFPQEQSIIAISGEGSIITMNINSNVMSKNGNAITLDVPPQIVNSRTLVPLRAVGESLDANVEWISTSMTVNIIKESLIQLSNSGTGNQLSQAVNAQNSRLVSVSALPAPSNGGTVSGGGSVEANSIITLQAIPSNGWKFDGWYERGTKINSDTVWNTTVFENKVYHAQFSQLTEVPTTQQVNIISNASPSNGGSVLGGGSYPSGSTVRLQAVPSNGWEFDGWYENEVKVNTNIDWNFSASSNKVLTAQFSSVISTQNPKQVGITLTASPSNGGTVSGGGTLAINETVTVQAVASNGWAFDSWFEDGVKISANATWSFKATENKVLQAQFVQNTANQASNQVSLTTTASPSNGGTVTGGGTFINNETVTIQAVPSNGWEFDGWYENGVKVNSSMVWSFTATENKNIQARFSQSSPTQNSSAVRITLLDTPSGSTFGGGSYPQNSTVTLQATPNNRWVFDGWYENGVKLNSNLNWSFIATQDRIIEPKFTHIDGSIINETNVTLNLAATPNNGGTVSGGGSYPVNSLVTVQAVANYDWDFDGWYENGIKVSSLSNWEFSLTNNKTVQAQFNQKPTTPSSQYISVSVSASPNEGGSVTGSGTYETGKTVTIQAIQKAEWSFDGWYSENGTQVETNSILHFTAAQDIKLFARFTKLRLTLNTYSVILTSGQSTTLTSSDPNVKWSSSDSSMVSVDKNGRIKARQLSDNVNPYALDVTIYAQGTNGLVQRCEVKVVQGYIKVYEYGNWYYFYAHSNVSGGGYTVIGKAKQDGHDFERYFAPSGIGHLYTASPHQQPLNFSMIGNTIYILSGETYSKKYLTAIDTDTDEVTRFGPSNIVSFDTDGEFFYCLCNESSPMVLLKIARTGAVIETLFDFGTVKENPISFIVHDGWIDLETRISETKTSRYRIRTDGGGIQKLP